MPDSRSFRQLMGCFATGVTVVTAMHADGGPVGITINSLTSVSLDPPLVLFCLERKAHIHPVFRKASHFAVNILAGDQQDISRHFADYRHHAEPEGIWGRPQSGCPVLKHTLGWMVCRTRAIHKGGDHDIFLGEAVRLHKNTGHKKPLLYFHSRYRDIEE